MKISQIISLVFILTVAMFILFNHVPSMIELWGFGIERRILFQVMEKQREIEQILSRQNSGLKVKLASAEESIKRSKVTIQKVQKPEVPKPVVEPENKTKERRGFLFIRKKPR